MGFASRGELVSEVVFLRDCDCDGLFGVDGGVDADVFDEVTGAVDGFESFEGDVLCQRLKIERCGVSSVMQ